MAAYLVQVLGMRIMGSTSMYRKNTKEIRNTNVGLCFGDKLQAYTLQLLLWLFLSNSG